MVRLYTILEEIVSSARPAISLDRRLLRLLLLLLLRLRLRLRLLLLLLLLYRGLADRGIEGPKGTIARLRHALPIGSRQIRGGAIEGTQATIRAIHVLVVPAIGASR